MTIITRGLYLAKNARAAHVEAPTSPYMACVPIKGKDQRLVLMLGPNP